MVLKCLLILLLQIVVLQKICDANKLSGVHFFINQWIDYWEQGNFHALTRNSEFIALSHHKYLRRYVSYENCLVT